MLDDLRGYIQVATGLTEVTATKAREIVSALVTQGISMSTRAPDVIGQVQSMADDLLSTGKDNREMLLGMVRSEVDRTVARMGFVREDELAALRRQLQRLEEQVQTLHGAPESSGSVPPKPVARKKKVVVKAEDGS